MKNLDLLTPGLNPLVNQGAMKIRAVKPEGEVEYNVRAWLSLAFPKLEINVEILEFSRTFIPHRFIMQSLNIQHYSRNWEIAVKLTRNSCLDRIIGIALIGVSEEILLLSSLI